MISDILNHAITVKDLLVISGAGLLFVGVCCLIFMMFVVFVGWPKI